MRSGKRRHPPGTTKPSTTQLSRNIPALFRTQVSGHTTRSSTHGSMASSYSGESDREDDGGAHPRGTQSHSPHTHPDNLLRMADLRSVAEDIKESVAAAITGLKSEMRAISSRVAEVEATASK